MASKSYDIYDPTNPVKREIFTLVSQNSPRDSKRRLLLQTNPLFLRDDLHISLRPEIMDFGDYYGVSTTWSYFGTPEYDPSYSESLRMAALAFYSSCSDLRVNVAQAFAERQQTVDLVANAARRIALAYRSFRRADFRGVWRQLPTTRGKVANDWLAYQYGWRPLLQDVYGAMIATVEKPIEFPIKVTRKSSTVSDLGNVFSSYVTYDVVVYDRSMTTIKARCTVDESANSLARLGLDNPLLLAWELVPYSFVVDWFVPIGNWITLQKALTGLTVVDPSTTTSGVQLVHCKPGSNPSYFWGYENNSQSGESISRLKRKTRSTSIPNLPSPSFKNPLTISHAASAIALLSNVFGRR